MVRATFAGFTTALSALQANQKRLDLVGQNLANMNTEGYTRQELKVSSLNYQNPTSFYLNENEINVGFGSVMQGTTQLRDQFLDVQYRTQNAKTDYNDKISESLKTLSGFLDETKLDGIRQSFDDIQTAMTTMQDPAKVNDPVYEGELRSRIAATATLFNSAADQISVAQQNELQSLTGDGSSENGAAEKINQLLKEIASLNTSIYKGELVGNQVLELKDERNLKIDELSSYVPIKVTYYNEHKYTDAGEYSSHPDDLRIQMEYSVYSGTDATARVNAEKKMITLIDGHDFNYETPGNYGSVSVNTGKDGSPINASMSFKAAANSKFAGKEDATVTTSNPKTATAGAGGANTFIRLNSGTVQASLDMLSDAESSLNNFSNYRSYDYYTNRLDTLASTFATHMNFLNKMGVTGHYEDKYDGENGINKLMTLTNNTSDVYKQYFAEDAKSGNYLLLVSGYGSDAQTANGITAANIAVSKNWVNGTTHIGTKPDNQEEHSATDTILNMLHFMESPHKEIGNRSYADEMNSISTHLANDAHNNANALTTNKTVRASIATSKDQLSGVSLDEEAANMMTYVSSYNAAARLMTTLDEAIETLLSIGR